MASDADRFRYATPDSAAAALSCLAPPVQAWFRFAFGEPTAAQRAAWPALARGDNLLLAAPTGSGKTLAAFAPIFSALLAEPGEGVRCLYVAPLKALSRDAAKNLRRHLRVMRACRREDQKAADLDPGAGGNMTPRVRLGLRTGDTSPRVRRKQLLRPPHVLLTTPESLAILLTQPAGRAILRNVRWIVIDEVHALAHTKRGADLSLSLERLVAESCAAQRIGLSATCSPLEEAARFVAGVERPIALAQVEQPAPLELIIEPLPPDAPTRRGFLARLADRLEPLLKANRTTLIFTNIRSVAEMVCWALRRRHPAQARRFAVHHSSLAPERRRRVEKRLKAGRLRCVISSTSLELGVDIGSVDQVVLIHPPGGATRLLQRLGRSGHRPGQLRRGLLLTTGPADLLECIVTGASSRAGQIEPLVVPQQPLDVLCQHLVGMAIDAAWTPESALALLRRSHPYQNLDAATLQNCLDYLSGASRDGQPWLLPRLRWEDGRFTIIDQRTARLMRQNLGTILNEDPCVIRLLRLSDRGTGSGSDGSIALGTLDEGYADRLQPGDRFLLDGRCFQYKRREEGAILVEEVFGSPFIPHWASRGWSISSELAERIYLFRLQVAEALRDGPDAAHDFLRRDLHLARAACDEIIDLFQRQERLSLVPDVSTLLIEAVPTEVGAEYYLHTPLSRAGNDALLRLLCLRLQREHDLDADSVVADLGLLLSVRASRPIEPDSWRRLLTSVGFAEDFERCLETSLSFREQFARVAATGLMVLRHPWGGRRKVGGQAWASRRLFDLVRQSDPHFVLLRQAEAEMRSKVCDAPAALRFLERLPRMTIQMRWLDCPSPFAESWTQPAEVWQPTESHVAGC